MSSPLLRRLLSTCSATRSISWNTTGRPQQTLASAVSRSGTALHSGDFTTARLVPAAAGEGRYFVACGSHSRSDTRIPASVGHVVESALCTTLCRDGARVRTVEHLMSALEACGVDNCRIEIDGGDEVPLLDGSAKEWVETIRQAGLCVAEDQKSNNLERLVPKLHEPLYLCQGSSFLIAFPAQETHITCGIDFPKVPAIGSQWFSTTMDEFTYTKEIASARTFCIYEEVEAMRQAGLIKGGSADNAIVCSATAGWLNPPLRFCDEPCRHKVLDLVGDFSLFAQNGNQGLLVAHIIAYKAGHALHNNFVRLLLQSSTGPECLDQRILWICPAVDGIVNMPCLPPTLPWKFACAVGQSAGNAVILVF
ncbi:putative UDP-3-O-acyl-N-acetylglucosamine deacetylase 2 [Canna indica]|uniref:UDP-3-O-acyl-N-acetylglucosamine deacetylase n=1 Tax=Canna indica TaxID=4628 RepID=A0AAQ3QK22_9LILI|nr:putative UDP-3-O-acyl-N-acetylglucosamine deacetylase 2 [Canna indica]